MRRPLEEQREIRLDVFRWLDDKVESGAGEVTRAELENYSFNGERIPLLDPNRGIRNPRDFDSTLSIMTSAKGHPYNDGIQPDGTIVYAFRSGGSADNVKLREAMRRGDPMVYFVGVRDAVFVPLYPVYIAGEDAARDAVTLVIGETHFFGPPTDWSLDERRYAERTVRQRLHQPLFRSRVLRAYEERCAVCRLRHVELLDAAHILADGSEQGIAAVPNGLALCKIHHASYDRDLMGISPDYRVHINRALLEEVDGPMLRHGLQEMNGATITLPRRAADQPDPERLAARFADFLRR